jgi:prepilin-type N-terminal cleavage/methylation domain-containing protein
MYTPFQNFRRPKIRHTRYARAFTLIETLVAISILLVVIVGPMTIAQKGIQSSYYASDQITAVFLAQEAAEAIREIRDNEALDAFHKTGEGTITVDESTWEWYSDLSDECAGVNGCKFDVESGIFEVCTAECATLFLRNDGRYVTADPGADGTQSIFRRTIKVTPDGSVGAQIEVIVEWRANIFGGQDRSVTLQTWIYDHYQRHGDLI